MRFKKNDNLFPKKIAYNFDAIIHALLLVNNALVRSWKYKFKTLVKRHTTHITESSGPFVWFCRCGPTQTWMHTY